MAVSQWIVLLHCIYRAFKCLFLYLTIAWLHRYWKTFLGVLESPEIF